MTEEIAKQLVVEMGKKLLQSNLTIRTWGNISVRIDNETFAISPSGYFYESLQPDDVVVLNVDNPDDYGDIKPSSERHIHSKIYKLNSLIKYIIHTHQKFASAVAGCSDKFLVEDVEMKKILGATIPVVKYAPAGTKKLANNILSVLEEKFSSVLLIPNHGAICFAATLEDAFLKAETLERFAKNFILSSNYNLAEHFFQYEKKILRPVLNFHASKRMGDCCVFYDVLTGVVICKMNIEAGNIIEGEFDFTSDLHRQIYADRPDINFIEQSLSPATLFVSKKMKSKQIIPAFLEDFAQIAGENIRVHCFFENKAEILNLEIVEFLTKRNAVAIVDSGVLCCVENYDDMQPLREIIEKNSLALISSWKYFNYPILNSSVAKKMRKDYVSNCHY